MKNNILSTDDLIQNEFEQVEINTWRKILATKESIEENDVDIEDCPALYVEFNNNIPFRLFTGYCEIALDTNNLTEALEFVNKIQHISPID